jgi:hypothetical protein
MCETGPTLGKYEVVEVTRKCSLEGKQLCFLPKWSQKVLVSDVKIIEFDGFCSHGC